MNNRANQIQPNNIVSDHGDFQIGLNSIQQSIMESSFYNESIRFSHIGDYVDRSHEVELLEKLCEKCKQNIFRDKQQNKVEGSIQLLLDQNNFLVKSYFQSQAKINLLESTLQDKNNEINTLKEQLISAQTNLAACKKYISNNAQNELKYSQK